MSKWELVSWWGFRQESSESLGQLPIISVFRCDQSLQGACFKISEVEVWMFPAVIQHSFAQDFFIDFWLCVPFVFCLWCQQLRQSNRKPIMNHTPLRTRGIAGFCKRNSGFLWRGSWEKAQTNWELQGFAFHEHVTMCIRLWILDVTTKGASLPEKCRWWFAHYDKHWGCKKKQRKTITDLLGLLYKETAELRADGLDSRTHPAKPLSPSNIITYHAVIPLRFPDIMILSITFHGKIVCKALNGTLRTMIILSSSTCRSPIPARSKSLTDPPWSVAMPRWFVPGRSLRKILDSHICILYIYIYIHIIIKIFYEICVRGIVWYLC